MDELLIQSACGGTRLLFFDREPFDRSRPIDGYWVRVTDQNLSAACRVDVGYDRSHPASLFADMARQWQGWMGELAWESLYCEFGLRCSHDRLGHIRIGVRLDTGTCGDDYGWEVHAAVMAEAGQLDRLAREAAAFFGESEGD